MSALTAELFYSPAEVLLFTYFFECYYCCEVLHIANEQISPVYKCLKVSTVFWAACS